MTNRRILHLDMDAFYASVEVLDNPELKGQPVIVGGDSQRGVVSAASYAARSFGVHSALAMAIARQRCPQGVFLRPRMYRYQEVSRHIMEIFHRFTPLVEPLSLDEAFLDVSESIALFGSAETIAHTIRSTVLKETGLTVSAGVATSKLIAKIASDMQKPDGLTIVEPGLEQEFLAPLPIAKLWGVGKTGLKSLTLLGIATIGDLRALPLELLERKFGKHGIHLFQAARAIDQRPVEPERSIQSIGHEDTFREDLVEMEEIQRRLLSLATRVGRRLRRHAMAGKTLTVKVKYNDFAQVTRSMTRKTATSSDAVLFKEGLTLLQKTMAGQKPMRLLGISVSKLESGDSPRQGSLFGEDIQEERLEQLDKAVDAINEKYGGGRIKPGRLVE